MKISEGDQLSAPDVCSLGMEREVVTNRKSVLDAQNSIIQNCADIYQRIPIEFPPVI